MILTSSKSSEKWVLEKNESLQPRGEDEEDGLVPLLVLNAPQALSQYVMKKKRRKERVVRKSREERVLSQVYG